MEIEGTILSTLFYSSESDYSIAKLETDDDIITICGYFKIKDKARYIFTGDYFNHPKYGKQFKVSTSERVIDNSKEGIVNYLSSDLFKGIGPVTAELIYDKLGPNCIDMILKDENILKKVGLSDTKISRLYNDLLENQGMQKILVKLYSYGISPKMANKLYKTYGLDTIHKIEENPYRLITDVEGYSFLKADALAMEMGLEKDDPRRINASVLYVMQNITRQYGYTFLYINQLIETAYDFLSKTFPVSNSLINDSITFLIENKVITLEDDKVFLSQDYYFEIEIAKKIKEISNNVIDVKKEEMLYHIEEISKKIAFDYTERQKEAITVALTNPITIITGGPGTGKTTIIDGIIKTYCSIKHVNPLDSSICLIAPTGRAAKRMFDATNMPSSTIHRRLGYDYTGHFLHDRNNPLKYDLIIIDEASMIDIYLAYQLFDAITNKSQVIIVGDVGQLPSVGPGRVLEDIIESGVVTTIFLKEIHRQALDSNIIKLSNTIRQGNIYENLFNNRDLFFIKTSANELSKKIIEIIKEMIDSGYSLQDDIQVLIPMYKGIVGINQINEDIRNNFNPSKEVFSFGEKKFRINDKVLQLVNNPNKSVMNGDVGYVKEIVNLINDDGMQLYLKVKYDNIDVLYKKDELEEISLAYAISIHKSQGSEYPIVILPILRNYTIMLRKKLIYTAVTRAKGKLFILGEYEAFRQGINSIDDERQTILSERLKSKDKKQIYIEDCPFTTFGEYDMENITPYSFMELENNK